MRAAASACMIGGFIVPSRSSWWYLVAAMFARFRRRIGLIGLFAVVLVSNAHGAPADNASTDNCLASPNSLAPDGSHWFYRVDLQSAVKCWYLRVTGQTEQKAAPREKPATAARATPPNATAPRDTASHTTASHETNPHATASRETASHTTASHATAAHAPGSHVQLIRRSSSSVLGADSPGSERPTGRDDSASPSADVGIDAPGTALLSKASRGAPAGETFGRTVPEERSSPSIEVIRVRNSNELQMGDEVPAPRQPVRVVWPALGSEAQPAAVSKADTKDQTALLVRPEPDVATSPDTEVAASPSEGTSGASRVGKLAVLFFLSFGLPGAGILAWLVMRADNARGEQFAARRPRANRADDRRSRHQRRARGVENRREADWLDDFLADLAEQQPPAVRRNPGYPSVGRGQPRADVADTVLRDILSAFRRKAAAGYDSGGYAAPQRRMAAR